MKIKAWGVVVGEGKDMCWNWSVPWDDVAATSTAAFYSSKKAAEKTAKFRRSTGCKARVVRVTLPAPEGK